MAGEKVVELEPRKLLPQDPTGRGFSEGEGLILRRRRWGKGRVVCPLKEKKGKEGGSCGKQRSGFGQADPAHRE